MDRTPTSDIAFVVVGSALTLISWTSLLRAVPFRQLSLWLRSSNLPRWRSAAERDDELGLIVKAKMQQLKVGQFRRACHILCPVVSTWTMMMVVNTLRGVAVRQYWGMDLVQCVGLGVLTLITVCPGVVTWKTIDVFYMVGMVITTGLVAPGYCENERTVLVVFVVDFVVICLSMVRGRLRFVVAPILVYATVSSVALVSCGEWPIEEVRFHVVIHLALLMVFPVVTHFHEVGMASAIRQTLENQAARELLSAVSALLRSCCDVVVELNSDGTIARSAEDLGGFLMRGPNCNLQGAPLADLIPDEDDKKMFCQKLFEKRPEGVGLAEAIHVGMRDVNNVQLKVEILSVQFHHLDGQPRYMIGLREFLDASAAGRQQQHRHANAPDPTGSDAEPPDNTAEEDGVHDEDLSCDSAASAGLTGFDVATLIIDSTEMEDLPIRGCSSMFRMRIGRLAPGSCLRDLVSSGHDFAHWLSMAAEYGSDWPDNRVTLNLRQGRFKAICRVVPATGDEAIDPKRVPLRFFGIQRCRSHSDGCTGFRPHTNFRGTPVLRMAL